MHFYTFTLADHYPYAVNHELARPFGRFTRVLMNAPVQGTLPWFYNQVLPAGEKTVLRGATYLYQNIGYRLNMNQPSCIMTGQLGDNG